MKRMWKGAFALAGALTWMVVAPTGCSNIEAGKAPVHAAAAVTPADAGASARIPPSTSPLVTTSAIDAGDPYHTAGESIAELDRRIGEIKKHAPTYYNLSAADRAQLEGLVHAKAALLDTTTLAKPTRPDKTRDPALDITAGASAPKDGGAK